MVSNNFLFDPLGINHNDVYWFASDIRVPTLWDKVYAKGGVNASINWPVTIGATSINYNIPDYWYNTSDSAIGELIAAVRKVDPSIVIVVVSDHGFASVQHDVNLMIPFVKAGLVKLDSNTHKVKSWHSIPWFAGGSIAIVLANPNDNILKHKVELLLNQLAKDPNSGIAKIITQSEIAARRGPKEVSFFIDLKLGYEMINYQTTGSLISSPTYKGIHGYFPEHKEMNATFMISGPNIPKHGSLGQINMLDIAPTIAKLLGVSLPDAKGKSLF